MRIKNRMSCYSFRLYLVCDGERVLGKGGAQVLSGIDRLGSLSATARELKMSYRFVWNYVHRMEDRLGKPVIITRRGGTPHTSRRGGGEAKLTSMARTLLSDYTAMERRLQQQVPVGSSIDSHQKPSEELVLKRFGISF